MHVEKVRKTTRKGTYRKDEKEYKERVFVGKVRNTIRKGACRKGERD